MAPWEELRYFNLPIVNSVTVGAGATGVQLCKANPMRVALYMQDSGQSNLITVQPDTGAGIQGFILPTQNVWQDFFAHEDMGMVQARWIATSNAPGPFNIGVVEITMIRWPENRADSLSAQIKRLNDSISLLSRSINRAMALLQEAR